MKKQTKTDPSRNGERIKTLNLPLAPLREDVYLTEHLDFRLSIPNRRTLRRLFDGLDEAGARLPNGRRVVSVSDAVRFVLDRLADENDT